MQMIVNNTVFFVFVCLFGRIEIRESVSSGIRGQCKMNVKQIQKVWAHMRHTVLTFAVAQLLID